MCSPTSSSFILSTTSLRLSSSICNLSNCLTFSSWSLTVDEIKFNLTSQDPMLKNFATEGNNDVQLFTLRKNFCPSEIQKYENNNDLFTNLCSS